MAEQGYSGSFYGGFYRSTVLYPYGLFYGAVNSASVYRDTSLYPNGVFIDQINSGSLYRNTVANPPIQKVGALMAGMTRFVPGGKDTTDGNPSQPCIRLDAYGRFSFKWRVLAGTRTISVNVKQPYNQSPRPSLVIRANTEVGVNADVSASAASSTDWVTIGPLTINPTSDGAVMVELRNNIDAWYKQYPCYFDHVVVA